MQNMAQDRLNSILGAWLRLTTQHHSCRLFPNNVLFIGDNLTGVIDFYFACEDILAYDVVIEFMVFRSRWVQLKNLVHLLAATRRYDHWGAEIAAIPVLTAGSAMRFFLTRLYDWLRTPKDALVSQKSYGILGHPKFHQSVSGVGAWIRLAARPFKIVRIIISPTYHLRIVRCNQMPPNRLLYILTDLAYQTPVWRRAAILQWQNNERD